MIIEILQQTKNMSRGRICYVIDYVFDVAPNGYKLSRKDHDEVTFIGASDSLCCADPQHPFEHRDHHNNAKRLDLSEIKYAFEQLEEKNKRVRHPFKHIVISLREGEVLSPSVWNELVHDYVSALGYSDNHWIALSHENTSNQHIHLILSCIENTAPHLKTKDGNDYAKSAKIRHELEIKYNLEQDNNPFISNIPGNKVNNSPIKTKIQTIRGEIDKITVNKKALKLTQFIDELAEVGIGCLARLDGLNVEGLSFSLGAEYYSGASLGQGYSWRELNQRCLKFTATEDLDDLLYSIDREQFISLLVNQAYSSDSIDSESGLYNHHYLIEPDEDTEDFSESSRHVSYSLFKIFTPIDSAVVSFKNAAQRKLYQLRKLRSSLYDAYDFMYSYGTRKLHSLKDYTARCTTKLKYLFERHASQNPVRRILANPDNRNCLERTRLLIVPAAQIDQGEPSTREFALETDIETSSCDHKELNNLDNPPGVIVMGDYNNPVETESVSEQSPNDNIKSDKEHFPYTKSRSSDSEFTF
ncbi:hypothetical protein D210916BOD24_11010 [Alteromonas sp. D210916BOD_24]|uniref:relaxase/mobilization nuclease domain-containing protein n=1 Tax=Alteromonas sp. D210916BOD_24 TaxID=3157618 RepID=UPI00399C9E22